MIVNLCIILYKYLYFIFAIGVAVATAALLRIQNRSYARNLEGHRAAVPNAFQRSIEWNCIFIKSRSIDRREVVDLSTPRILSWNIERGQHPGEIARYIECLRPDIVCLQEVDWGNKRTDSTDVLDELVRRTHLLGLYSVEFLEIASPFRSPGMEGGGVTGNAMLTRIEPVTTFRAELPVCLDWEHGERDPQLPAGVRRRIRREKRVGMRFALCAEFSFDGKPLVVASVHLEDVMGGVAGRYSQFMGVVSEIRRRHGDSAISVIAGDFNTFDCPLARASYTPDSEADAMGKPERMDEGRWWKEELLPRSGYADPFDTSDWTFQVTPLFRRKLDWIAVRGGAVASFGVGPFSSSDHRPLWIDLAVDLTKPREQDSPGEENTENGVGTVPSSGIMMEKE
jgi:endonuclease/exonuclease/phosphatase family metal-dependent hydrolase